MERRSFIKRSLAAIAAISASSVLPVDALSKNLPTNSNKQIPRAKRVLMIGLDGICVEGFQKAHTPNLDKLLSGGALSIDTRVVMPSNTQPNWMSHLSGSGPEIHGVDRNDWLLDNHTLPALVTDEEGYYPTLFKVLKDNIPAMKTAFYYNWAELINPYNRKYLDEVSFEENDLYTGNYAKALDFMRAHRNEPSTIFLYSVHTDHAGHNHTWMSPQYIEAIEEADVNIGKLLDQMKADGLFNDTHILFITDHGGINWGHGGMTTNEMIVPWGITGPGIAKGFKITEPNNTVNTASVILNLFGVEQPLYWTGEVPMSIFA
ncbi:MAG: alkaline phosphatase [Muribaculaceae bacterium]|nr:alkaline phosphatase [Muribaculaceae bacterium]